MRFHTVKSAFIASMPVLVGYVTMGSAFGILIHNSGVSTPLALLMSVTLLSGSMQFAAIGLLAAGASFVEIAMMTLLINVRYAVYGIPFLQFFKGFGPLRFYMIFTLADEAYALYVENKFKDRPQEEQRRYMFFIGFFDHCYWVIGTFIGCVAGTLINWDFKGVEFTMTALFLVILTEQCMDKRNRLPAVIGGAVTIASLLIFGVDRMLFPAMLGIIGALLLLRKYLSYDVHRKSEECA